MPYPLCTGHRPPTPPPAARTALAAALALAAGATLPGLARAAGEPDTPVVAPPAAVPSDPSPPPRPPAPPIDTVQITGRHYDNAVGSSDAASQGVIRAELLKSRPALRPGEVLEFVPGVVVTQHSGDGKANQYFLRGFNLDHGTDFATTVDGLPVNMPTHGHGQGYSDLNFLIPELVDRIAYRKGPYFADAGDFALAGAADIRYRTRLAAPLAQLSLGQRGYARALLAGSAPVGGAGSGLQLLGALELMANDGPWTVPEALRRRNGVLTLSGGTAERGWQIGAQAYSAQWTATDQVPQRLIDAGQWRDGATLRPFGRWDSLDPSDGGHTERSSLSARWHDRDADGQTRVAAYAMRYGLALWSNFTYHLDRGAAGDQFEQRDQRSVWGLSASRSRDLSPAGLPLRAEWGLQLRHDRVRVGLSDTVARVVTTPVRDDRVRQTQLGLYAQGALELTPWLRGVAGLRADALWASVDSGPLADNGGSAHAARLSPKLSLVAGPWARTEFFANAGQGLHSNDARGSTIRTDPRSGDPAERVLPLVAGQGWELGARTEALPGLQSSVAAWWLRQASELLYVGDAGTTEAGAASRRRGIEWNNRYTPVTWLLLDADLAWSHARFADGRRIPNAVDRVGTLALTLREAGPWSASLAWRYLGSAALTEDNTVRSQPSLTANLRLSRALPRAWGFGPDSALTLDVFNLADRRVDDIQYHYASDVGDGQGAVDDRHVHPAEPRTWRLTLRLSL